MSFRRGNVKRVQGHAVHGGGHHPASVGCRELFGRRLPRACKFEMEALWRARAERVGWCPASEWGFFFVFELLFAGPKGWWDDHTMWLPTSWLYCLLQRLCLPAKFPIFPLRVTFGFNSPGFLCRTNRRRNTFLGAAENAVDLFDYLRDCSGNFCALLYRTCS